MYVIIADHNSEARKAIAQLLREQPRINVVGEVADSNSLLDLVAKQGADVIVLDSGLPSTPLAELISQLRKIIWSLRVIAMSCDPENARFSLISGASFFVSKGNQPEWLLETLYRCEKK
jgi:DNA-binding NarL/FixJ family response regulator